MLGNYCEKYCHIVLPIHDYVKLFCKNVLPSHFQNIFFKCCYISLLGGHLTRKMAAFLNLRNISQEIFIYYCSWCCISGRMTSLRRKMDHLDSLVKSNQCSDCELLFHIWRKPMHSLQTRTSGCFIFFSALNKHNIILMALIISYWGWWNGLCLPIRRANKYCLYNRVYQACRYRDNTLKYYRPRK